MVSEQPKGLQVKRIQLPRTASRWYLSETLSALRSTETETGRLLVDWSLNTFAGPGALAAIAAHAIAMGEAGADLEFENWNPDSYEARVQMKLVCGLPDDYPYRRRDPTRRFTDVTRVRGPRESRDFAREASEMIKSDFLCKSALCRLR